MVREEVVVAAVLKIIELSVEVTESWQRSHLAVSAGSNRSSWEEEAEAEVLTSSLAGVVVEVSLVQSSLLRPHYHSSPQLPHQSEFRWISAPPA